MTTRFRLREAIEGAKTTQSDLARASSVSYVTINRMCANLTAQVSLRTLDRLSDVLGVEPGELITRDRGSSRSRRG